MNDLLKSMQEHAAERLAIMQESGVTDAVIHADDDLLRCEVKSVIRRYYPTLFDRQSIKEAGEKIEAYCKLVESKRGKVAADKLRDASREAWKARKIADSMAGQG